MQASSPFAGKEAGITGFNVFVVISPPICSF